MPSADRRATVDDRIQRVMDLIINNYDKPLSVPDLARAAGMSVSRFSHLFRDNVGVSPARFLRDYRMREAEHLITTTTLPMTSIFPRVGVTDRSHFVRRFRLLYGSAPSDYRARHSCDK